MAGGKIPTIFEAFAPSLTDDRCGCPHAACAQEGFLGLKLLSVVHVVAEAAAVGKRIQEGPAMDTGMGTPVDAMDVGPTNHVALRYAQEEEEEEDTKYRKLQQHVLRLQGILWEVCHDFRCHF